MVAYIRTMVKGEHAANDEIEARLDSEGWDGFGTFLGAVFYFAVNRRFPTGASRDEVIRFVGEMRSTSIGGPETDAASAEKLVSAALNPSLDTDIEPMSAGRIQGLTILHTLGGGAVTDEDLDALLGEAATLANRLRLA
ncbi:hypothetical protein ACN28G_03075 [Micromonospora sp. WMMA1923]|uniref:hypothetical protein n=1 Tax=Micromonospora sp. WMMA1923 TaxID=3404125 RepID=UPI003B944161